MGHEALPGHTCNLPSFPAELYMQLWDVLGVPLTHSFNACHMAGARPKMSARQRTSDYTLVPKQGDARDLANRRPIAGIIDFGSGA
jgi:hypothetical protein